MRTSIVFNPKNIVEYAPILFNLPITRYRDCSILGNRSYLVWIRSYPV
jgi:hypothetical protein